MLTNDHIKISLIFFKKIPAILNTASIHYRELVYHESAGTTGTMMILIWCNEIHVFSSVLLKIVLPLVRWVSVCISVYLNQDAFILLCKRKSIKIIAVRWMKVINHTHFSSGLHFISTKKPITYKWCTYMNSCSGFFLSGDLALWMHFLIHTGLASQPAFLSVDLSSEGEECENSDNNG